MGLNPLFFTTPVRAVTVRAADEEVIVVVGARVEGGSNTSVGRGVAGEAVCVKSGDEDEDVACE